MSDKPSTVLVVDDDRDIREVLRDVLVDAGHHVEMACDGSEGLEKLRALAPEVALVDVQMPGLTGTELLERLAESGSTTKVVLMTAFANAATESSALRLNAHAFLVKPFELDVVLAAVSSAARVHRLEAENRRMNAGQREREEALRVAAAAAEQRAEQLDALHALAVLSSETLDLEEVLARSVRLVERLFSGTAEVRLFDESAGRLSASTEPGSGPDEVARRAAIQREVVSERTGDGGLWSAAPLEARGRLLGVLCLTTPVEPKPAARELLPRLAATMAIALENAQLFQRSQVALERANDAQQRQLESERLAVIGQMTAGLAHELNTPVAYLLANLHVLRRGLASLPVDATSAEWQSIVDDCMTGAERIRGTVRDLRLFGRGGPETLQSTDLNALVDSVLGLMRAELVRSAQLERRFGEVPLLGAHPGRLAQALLQLMRNAVQAVQAGGPDRVVEVSTGVRDGQAIVTVRDTGAGMSPDVLARAFEPFFSTRPVGQGVGLGLSMAMDVVRHHGGELRLTSRPGEGTTAEVSLPLRMPEQTPPPETVRRRRILVVDEDRTVLHAFKRLIGRKHEIVTVEGGRAALSLLDEDDAFDLVLCDLNMPDVSGPDVHDELAREKPALLSRFAVLTGGALDERQIRLVEALGPRVLGKPFTMGALERLLTLVS